MHTVAAPLKNGLADFHGDFSEVAELMQRSWAENNEQPLLYTPEFLASIYDHPAMDGALSPVLYRKGDLTAFIAGLPRTARFEGRRLRVIINAFLTVANEWKKAGYGPMIWTEVARRAQARGFDGAISYCVEGDGMNGILNGVAALTRQPVFRIFTVSYLARVLRPTPDSTLPTAGASEAAQVLPALAADLPDEDALVREWGGEEAEWQCNRRLGAVALALECGDRRGAICGYMMDTSGARPTRCVLLDDILFGDLDVTEQDRLLGSYLELAQEKGAELAIAPVLGYANLEPLMRAQFRKTQRVLHAYYRNWTGRGPAGPVRSMYMDII
jgi:hypothetical protein